MKQSPLSHLVPVVFIRLQVLLADR
jgi:hypothetical protein